MNPRDDDGFELPLGRLTPLRPDDARAARTRDRCRRRLTRPDWRTRVGADIAPFAHRLLEPTAALLAATVFLGDVIIRALQLYGVLGD
jgi:hypothetical protein